MNRIFRRGIALAAILSLCPFAFPDTLILKDGTRVTGYYEGGTARVVRFETGGRVREYDLLTVEEILFGGTVTSSGTPEAGREAPRLLTPDEAARPATSATAANGAFAIPRGTLMLVRLVDGINSEENETGQAFRATLADPLLVDGVEVVPADAEVRGQIVEAEGAGRINGAAELRLELTEIAVNGLSYALTTSEYQEAAESRGGQTATRVGAGAGIGALVGLLAGGGRGAAIGAGVGAGTAGVVQVLTKGEKLYIPAETLLEFTLSEPLMVAAR
jgi:hypothetical protein